jgi:uncharacterized damage-inducible protein DinB
MAKERQAMMAYPSSVSTSFDDVAIHPSGRILAASDRMTRLVIENLEPALWLAKPPGNTRPIAAIVTHMHNVRAKWIRLSAPHLGVPAQLNRARITAQQAQAALAESAALCGRMLAEAMSGNGEMRYFRRDALAKPWPVAGAGGLQMLGYMITHEAHHRGQICMIAHQLGHPLPGKVTAKIWNWDGIARSPESLRG